VKKKDIEIGRTYKNRCAGTTTRTVLDIIHNPVDGDVPGWFSSNPRPRESVVKFKASNRPGWEVLYLTSFAAWAGGAGWLGSEISLPTRPQ